MCLGNDSCKSAEQAIEIRCTIVSFVESGYIQAFNDYAPEDK
jgi:hypothetical protein